MLHLFQFWSDSSFATQHPISIAPQYTIKADTSLSIVTSMYRSQYSSLIVHWGER